MTNELFENDLRQTLSRQDEEVPPKALCDTRAAS